MIFPHLSRSSHYAVGVLLTVCFMLIAARPVSAHQSPADTLGQMSLRLPTDSAYVVVDRDFRNPILVTREDSVITLPVGERHITVAFRDFWDQPFITEVTADTIDVVYLKAPQPLKTSRANLLSSSFPRLAWRSNLTIHSDPDARIYVDDEQVGVSVAHLDLPAGTYSIHAERPNGRRKSTRISVRDDRMSVAEVYVKPDRTVFFGRAILPGGGQTYRGDYIKGATATVAVLGLGTGALLANRHVITAREEFRQAQWEYSIATDEQTAWDRGNQTEILADRVSDRLRTRNIWLGAAATAYIVQLVDALWPPRDGFRQRISSDYLLSPTVGPEGAGLRLQLELN